MAGPDSTLIEEYQARIGRLKKELEWANDLIEHYRQFAPGTYNDMPPSYFSHTTAQGLVMGRLIDGQLVILETGFADYEGAVAAAQKHYKALIKEK